MKHFAHYLCLCLALCGLVTLASCGPEEEETIEVSQIDKYKQDIVGKWRHNNTSEYWRFDAAGSGSTGYGENWDTSEDIHEGDGNDFQWQINSNGLMVIYKLGGGYSDPDPEAPFSIKSITSTSMTWVTSTGTTQYFTRMQ